jgi:hypothetical protein
VRPALLLTLALVPLSAYAEEEGEEEQEDFDDYRIGGELGLYHNDLDGDGSFTSLTEVIDADLTFLDALAVSVSLPFAQIIISDGQTNESRFRIGNPTLAAYYQYRDSTFRVRIGGGIGIPAAQVPNDDDEGTFLAFIVYGAGLAMHGLQSPWLWTPESLPLLLPSFRFDADLGLVSIDGRADIVLLFTLDEDFQDDVEVAIPLEAGVLVHVQFVGIGARLGLGTFPTAGDDIDAVQVSLSPRITFDLDFLELEARLSMNLDDPFGFAFDNDGFFGFFLGAHAVF